METEDDDERPSKRIHFDIENSLKKIRISRYSPGQLRFSRDLEEFVQFTKSSADNATLVKIDPKNAHACHVRFASNFEYTIIVDRHYPHKPPMVMRPSSYSAPPLPIALRILQAWLPTYTISDVFKELEKL